MARYRLPIIAAFVALLGITAITATANAWTCRSIPNYNGGYTTYCY